MSPKNKILQRINEYEPGTIFCINDLYDIGSYNTIIYNLKQLEKTQKIIKIYTNIYMIPQESLILKEQNIPSVKGFISCLARKNKWMIMPSGDNCLNLLGLSPQIPIQYTFLSDGPNRIINFRKIKIKFIHIPLTEIKDFTQKEQYIIQAIKAYGQKNINKDFLLKIKNLLNEEELEDFFEKAKYLKFWLAKTIQSLKDLD